MQGQHAARRRAETLGVVRGGGIGRARRVLVAAAMGVTVAAVDGCASARGGGAAGAPDARLAAADARATREAREAGLYELRASDLQAVDDAPSMLAAIERLRPIFLRPRGASARLRGGQGPNVSVFIDGMFAGPVDVLRTVAVRHVAYVRYVQPVEAVTRLGQRGAGDGVIEVTLAHR